MEHTITRNDGSTAKLFSADTAIDPKYLVGVPMHPIPEHLQRSFYERWMSGATVAELRKNLDAYNASL